MIGERLAPAANYTKPITIEDGGTLFVVHSVDVATSRVRGGSSDFEGLILRSKAPPGVLIHRRIDEITITPKGEKTEVSFRYAISVEPGTKKGGAISLELSLVERAGLANVATKVKLRHDLKLSPAKPSEGDLAADFRGYRAYKALAKERIQELDKKGLGRITLTDDGELGRLDRLDGGTIQALYELDRWRRRMAVARRHLSAASNASDRAVAKQAKQYLKLLDAPDEQLAGLPAAALGPSGAAAIETLQPEQSASTPPAEPTPPPLSKATETKSGVTILQPLEHEETKKREAEDLPARRPDPKTPVKVDRAREATEAPGNLAGDELGFNRGLARETPIPLYPRSLTLDDPNLAHAGSLRFSWAKISDQQTAVAPAWFFFIQTAITRDIGLDLTVPTVYVSVNLARADPLFVMGNPLLGVKYRIHLPEIEGRRPVLTVRARWGIPVSPLSTVPRTQLIAEQFSLPAHFVDTYAFMLEKHDFGVGAIASYEIGMLHVTGQIYGDYFLPVKDSGDELSFLALAYGVSIGIRPFGDLIGAYAEGRGTSLLTGPRRAEFFSYLGVRAHLLDYLEPALWISLPLGSVGRVSSVQFGGELRFSYDVEGVIVRGKGRAAGPSLLE